LGGDAVLTSPALEGAALDAALAHPLDGPLLVLAGPAGTGKTTPERRSSAREYLRTKRISPARRSGRSLSTC
jgi:putative ribosome biogenesis GTPase RsgA